MSLQESSQKIFFWKLVIHEIRTQIQNIKEVPKNAQDQLESPHQTELENLQQMLSKYEKKLNEAMNDDNFLVKSEIEKLTKHFQKLNLHE